MAAIYVLVYTMLSFLYSSAIAAKGHDQPHIIFLLIDDMGFNDNSFENDLIKMPATEALARHGVRLTNYYVQQSCSPTRCQLMTGRYQIHLGMQHGYIWNTQAFGLPLDEVTLADKLKEVGYATHLVGKWHLGFFEEEYMPQYRGFDTMLGFLGSFIYYYTYTSPYEGVPYLDFRDENGPVDDYIDQHSVYTYNDRVMKILAEHDQDTPLFLYLAHQSVHSPLQVPLDYMFDKSWDDLEDQNRKTFFAMITQLDENIGNLTDTLKENGMWDDTLIVLSTDNGGAPENAGNNWPLRGSKGSFWEGGLKGPAVVAGGYFEKHLSIKKGSLLDGLFHVTDWFPTLLGQAGGNTHGLKGPIDGKDQWDMITKGHESARSEILHNIDELKNFVGERLYYDTFDTRMQASIRVNDYKLLTGDQGDSDWYAPPEQPELETIVSNDPPSKNVWLFNIRDDPTESKDISDENPDIVRELLDRLAKLDRTRVDAWWPPTNNEHSNPALNGGVWGPWYVGQITGPDPTFDFGITGPERTREGVTHDFGITGPERTREGVTHDFGITGPERTREGVTHDFGITGPERTREGVTHDFGITGPEKTREGVTHDFGITGPTPDISFTRRN